MHSIHFVKPSVATRRFVRFYAHRVCTLPSSVLVHPVPARSEHVLDFQFTDAIRIQNLDDGTVRRAQSAALIGLQTHRRVEQLIHAQIESFTIFLQPSTLSVLFDLPGVAITDSDQEAHGILGRSASELREQLGNSRSFQQRVQIAEAFFTSLCAAQSPASTIELVANEIFKQHGVCRIDTLARDAGLSDRTLHRQFLQSVGVAPKTYARIVRFESALQTKATFPQRLWTDIAHQYEYHDQMHMIHDFSRLSAETPSGLLTHLDKILPPDDRNGEKGAARLLL
jgi:AraC-like DNA-binding protein